MSTSYRCKIGNLACTVMSDGTYTYRDPARVLFANAPQEHLDRALRERGLDPVEWKELVSPYPALLIRTDRHLVLVDTGAGDMAPTTGKLIPNLRDVGVDLEDVDMVILTHAHPDHIGGSLDREGRPMFPKARYVLSRAEWDFWTSEPDLSSLQMGEPFRKHMIACARHNLPPLQSQLDLVEGETEIVPGIRVIPAPGHTPGQVAVAVHGAGEQLLYIADAALHPIHIEQPGWYAAVDIAPEQALVSRRQLLERAVAEGALVHAFHFPWPGLGYIARTRDAWQWQPLETFP
ncbi:MAG: MBL fold metallo-hydrolase [Anaerolineae bacterium]|nr:MBL fold metallo-hydrolase [Anaerolineae bacterium]